MTEPEWWTWSFVFDRKSHILLNNFFIWSVISNVIHRKHFYVYFTNYMQTWRPEMSSLGENGDWQRQRLKHNIAGPGNTQNVISDMPTVPYNTSRILGAKFAFRTYSVKLRIFYRKNLYISHNFLIFWIVFLMENLYFFMPKCLVF